MSYRTSSALDAGGRLATSRFCVALAHHFGAPIGGCDHVIRIASPWTDRPTSAAAGIAPRPPELAFLTTHGITPLFLSPKRKCPLLTLKYPELVRDLIQYPGGLFPVQRLDEQPDALMVKCPKEMILAARMLRELKFYLVPLDADGVRHLRPCDRLLRRFRRAPGHTNTPTQ